MVLPTALQYLPIPILVLSSGKSVILANEAMKALVGINPECKLPDETPGPDTLGERQIAEFGIKILQRGAQTSMPCEVCHVAGYEHL
jgi:hypothetical protein